MCIRDRRRRVLSVSSRRAVARTAKLDLGTGLGRAHFTLGGGGVGVDQRCAISRGADPQDLIETAELNEVEQEDRGDEDADGDERSHEKPRKLNLLVAQVPDCPLPGQWVGLTHAFIQPIG